MNDEFCGFQLSSVPSSFCRFVRSLLNVIALKIFWENAIYKFTFDI